MVRVLLAEAHSHLRAALHEYLVHGGEVVCDTADTSEEVWSRLRHEEWDVLILDLRLPEQTKLETVRTLHEVYPKLPILVISFAKDIVPRHWQDAGASGFLSKAKLSTELSEAVKVVSRGGKYFSQDEDEREERK
jgi:two-component system invasion response regulator UvrY